MSDSARRVLRLTGWTGGEGTAPTVPAANYITASGLGVLADAINIRGPAGDGGTDGGAAVDQRAETITFQAISAAGEMQPVASSPLGVLLPVGGDNEILSTPVGNDFEIEAGVHLITLTGTADATTNSSFTDFAIRDSSDDSELVHSTRPTLRSGNGQGVKMLAVLTLAASTTVHAYFDRRSATLLAGSIMKFVRIGGGEGSAR